MTLYARTIPPEMLKLGMDTRKDILTALDHIDDRNYGLAEVFLRSALDKLPTDDTNDQGIAWRELENRTT